MVQGAKSYFEVLEKKEAENMETGDRSLMLYGLRIATLYLFVPHKYASQ